MAHGFQDLCGQNINKVTKLVTALDRDIREMFRRLGCEIPRYNSIQTLENSVNQCETDDILREFGL
jgi:chemotaxis regulatin CheY-phosphate phosphatase CheZ